MGSRQFLLRIEASFTFERATKCAHLGGGGGVNPVTVSAQNRQLDGRQGVVERRMQCWAREEGSK